MIIHVITGLGEGGAEAVLYRLCLASPQQSLVISLGSTAKYSNLLQNSGVEVVHLNMPSGQLTLKGLWRLYDTMRTHRSGLVQTWMYHGDLVGGVIARLAGNRRVVWNVRHSDLDPDSTGSSTRWVAMLCARLSGIIPRRIVACAQRAKQVHLELGYDASKFAIIPNGYDITRFQPDPIERTRLRRELGLASDSVVAGLVGRWNPQKDHQNLLAAIALLGGRKDVSVLLVGRGCDDTNPQLKAHIDELGLRNRVLLLGPRDDIPSVMNALDLHILSSSHGEAFPNVVAEAMACGTPCIVTDVGDAAEIVGDTGWVVQPRDPASLADAIAHALNEYADQTVWELRRARARSRIVHNFSLDRMVTQYLTLWDEVNAEMKV